MNRLPLLIRNDKETRCTIASLWNSLIATFKVLFVKKYMLTAVLFHNFACILEKHINYRQ